jgi:hypothetical protein
LSTTARIETPSRARCRKIEADRPQGGHHKGDDLGPGNVDAVESEATGGQKGRERPGDIAELQVETALDGQQDAHRCHHHHGLRGTSQRPGDGVEKPADHHGEGDHGDKCSQWPGHMVSVVEGIEEEGRSCRDGPLSEVEDT